MINKKKKTKSILMGSNQLVKNIEPLISKYLKNKLKLRVIFVAKTKEDADYYKKQ